MNSNTEWQLSGTAAERYERYLVPTIFIPWAENLLARAAPQERENVLDVACGTGIVARMAAEATGPQGRVVGADLNNGMLDIARAKSSEAGKTIEWIEADVASLPFDDASFEVAICQQGLQFFPDKLTALKEIRRVLRPGGRCVICVARSLEHNPLMRAQVEALTRHINAEAAAAIRAVCGLSDADEIQRLFGGAGFADVQVESVSLTLTHESGLDFIAGAITSTPVADVIAGWSDDARDALLADILEGFGDCYDGSGLEFPHVAHVVTAANA